MEPITEKIELPADMHAMFDALSDSDAGQLIKAIFAYAVTGKETVFYGKAGDMLSGLFAVMRIAMDGKPGKKKKPKESEVKEVKHRYGVNNNVLLSDEEYKKICDEHPRDYQKRIDSLSCYIASSGKAYKSHYFTILNWARRDTGQDTPAVEGGSFDTDEFYQLALKRSYDTLGTGGSK